MKSFLKSAAVMLLFLGVLLTSASYAEKAEVTVDNHRYSVEVPDGYAIYTPELGMNSSYIKMTGYTDLETLNIYMKTLGSCLIGVHTSKYHELWLSIKDRSLGVGTNPTDEIIHSFYLGVAVSRGKFTVENHEGKDYYVFADGTSIYPDGANLYISTFIGHYEVAARWESGSGMRTEQDIDELKEIIYSVHLME